MPLLCASSTIAAPMRHFTEYAGFLPSIFASIVAFAPSAIRFSRTIGVRPEDVCVARDGNGPATVRVVEDLGATSTVTLHVAAAGTEGFAVRTIVGPAETLLTGQRCRLEAVPGRVLQWETPASA